MKETIIHITVPQGKKKERIDVFLAHQIENASRNKIQNAIKSGYVKIGDVPVKANHIVSPGEEIVVTLPKPPPPIAQPEEIPVDILYEDESIFIINKAAGMVTHPAHGNYTGTLVNALLHYAGTGLAESAEPLRPGIVHRLDKDTSGLMVVTKNDLAYQYISSQFSKRTIDREYWAVCWGTFSVREGTIEANLGRSLSDRKKITVRDDGKPAITRYEVIEEFNNLSLVKLKLLTGRTHQIRVHLAHQNRPVFGDPTYGGRRIVYGGVTPKWKAFIQNLLDRLPRQALHAKTLGFFHPDTKEKIFFESDLPDDIKYVIERLRSQATG